MKLGFKKVKTEHTILSEFHPLLRKIENLDQIQRIIPWRIMRQQKGSSDLRFSISYQTTSGLKAKMPKRYRSWSRNTHKQHSINSLEYTKYRALSLTYPQFSTPHMVLDPIPQPNLFSFSKSKRKKTSLTRNDSSLTTMTLPASNL